MTSYDIDPETGYYSVTLPNGGNGDEEDEGEPFNILLIVVIAVLAIGAAAFGLAGQKK